MAVPVKQGGYEVARPQGQCAVCQKQIEPEVKFMAGLLETAEGFERRDHCQPCWPSADRAGLVAFWQTAMPRPEQKKKLFVDDTILCELFERLGDVQEPAKLNFRFVLGLILMRKRLVVYESSRNETDHEVWRVRLKGRQDILDLVNPHLSEEQVKQVSEQLGEILQQEL